MAKAPSMATVGGLPASLGLGSLPRPTGCNPPSPSLSPAPESLAPITLIAALWPIAGYDPPAASPSPSAGLERTHTVSTWEGAALLLVEQWACAERPFTHTHTHTGAEWV